MEKVQILVATMGQKDFALVEKMNIRCGAILANQTDVCAFASKQYPFGTVQMVSTDTRGVGLNRNIAILAAQADFLLFADDDVCYYDHAPELVRSAFLENPQADVFIFSMDYTRNGEVIQRRYLPVKQCRLWNGMRYGACAMAIRREALLRYNLSFHQMFGGGCVFGSGEDSLFLRDCFRAGLKVYTHSSILGQCSRDESSWFTGYHEKFYYDKGVLVRYLFPIFGLPMTLYFANNHRKDTQLPYMHRLKCILAGWRGGKTNRTYAQWKAGE